MELERCTYVRDRQFDRRVTLVAFLLSVLALLVTAWLGD
jgi:predicted nucleic acid-binding Zn ribbon protein